MHTAKVFGLEMPFAVIANPVNGEVSCIVRIAGQEHRFTLTPEVAGIVADELWAAMEKAEEAGNVGAS
ncbi:hypothetical protein [Paramagnetospirillum magneticum]|uniref:Uncharacterized protein n=1 Tax=Paramagnetospirillum magneticum (strain ATCC 700264 / AMB-1) TaxID=342108 RepID=Q2W4H8_PARM1|nr:hypothetical protein [Paramagnetospirillum magneticum]BAE51200.1 hypothetical protein amb2396 [Paramagnetospirillum magneticum AMB-1]BAE51247.1 hypothetical protein amb2443 [Paramagnetospirillum magneticum AMB-1]